MPAKGGGAEASKKKKKRKSKHLCDTASPMEAPASHTTAGVAENGLSSGGGQLPNVREPVGGADGSARTSGAPKKKDKKHRKSREHEAVASNGSA